VCMCGGNGQLAAEWQLESLPTRGGVIGSSNTPPLLQKKTSFKTCRSFGKKKDTVMGPDVIRNQDLSCWRGPAAI
jgi:hypothetical protein